MMDEIIKSNIEQGGDKDDDIILGHLADLEKDVNYVEGNFLEVDENLMIDQLGDDIDFVMAFYPSEDGNIKKAEDLIIKAQKYIKALEDKLKPHDNN